MRIGNIFWGAALIVLGLMFALKAANLIDDVFGWFWPIFLILLGAWFVAGRYLPGHHHPSEEFRVELEHAPKLALELEHGAGSIHLQGGAEEGIALSGSKGPALDVKSDLTDDGLGVKVDAGPTFLPFLGPQDGVWHMKVSNEVPVSIKVSAGASKLFFDLTDVRLTFLGVDAGASNITVLLPQNAGKSLVDIESGAASVDVKFPLGVGGRIRLDQGASSIQIDKTRFLPQENLPGVYQSADYDTASSKVELTLDGGANTVRVE